jgi:peptidylprolyl isomerase
VANSRRRERELARRRYERRRLREQQLRARRRRRNTIAGASAGTAAVIALIVFLAVHFSGGSDKASAGPRATPPATATATPPATPTPPPPAPTRCAQIKPNPPAKGQPTVPPVTGKAPTKLVIKDIKNGHGPAAKRGSSVSVTYIGISCSTGKVFDASYLHGNQPFAVKPLGQASVIQGWNQGLIGVRAGGVRELVIPAALGYGPAGNQGIKPNETLIFLITVKSVKA